MTGVLYLQNQRITVPWRVRNPETAESPCRVPCELQGTCARHTAKIGLNLRSSSNYFIRCGYNGYRLGYMFTQEVCSHC
eukprot:3833526-Pyramimonas_sp.AAC.2